MKNIARFIRSITPPFIRRGLGQFGMFFSAGLRTHGVAEPVFPSIEGSLQTLRRLGFSFPFVVDIGAYHGEWTKMFKSLFPHAGVLMIEANESKMAILQKVAADLGNEVKIQIALLGSQDDERVIFHEMETGSSVFPEASHFSRKIIEKSLRRLDTVLEESHSPRVDFLKLDVQGYELNVLRGAPVALRQAKAVLLEASLVPINTGCPLIHEVVGFMAGNGFRLCDFCSQIRRADGVLWQTDLLFVRSDLVELPKPELTQENWR